MHHHSIWTSSQAAGITGPRTVEVSLAILMYFVVTATGFSDRPSMPRVRAFPGRAALETSSPSTSSSAVIIPADEFDRSNPRIDPFSSGNVSASLGRTAELTCKITDLGPKSVSWLRHSDTGLISVGKFQYIRDKRFRVVHHPQTQEWVLVITNLRHSDQGYYECQVNTSPRLSHLIYLNVIDSYSEIVGGVGDVFIDQHSTINLTCRVNSPERPDLVSWLKDGTPLQTDDRSYSRLRIETPTSRQDSETISNLVVRGAKPKDSGVYQCNPTNTKPTFINVHVLDGESTDALQTSGLSNFNVSNSFKYLLLVSIFFSLVTT